EPEAIVASVSDNDEVGVGILGRGLEEQMLVLVGKRIGLAVAKDVVDIVLTWLKHNMGGHANHGVELYDIGWVVIHIAHAVVEPRGARRLQRQGAGRYGQTE